MDKFSRTSDFWRKNILFIAALLIALMVTWKIIDQVNHNYRLEQRAGELRARSDLLAQQIKNQNLNNEFFRSDYYLELAIREQQGYLLPDENVLIIDEQKIIQIKKDYQPEVVITDESPTVESSNLQQWRNFVFDIDNQID